MDPVYVVPLRIFLGLCSAEGCFKDVCCRFDRNFGGRSTLESLGVRPGYAARFDSLAMSAGWVWGQGWMKVQVQVGVRCVCGTVVMGDG